MDKENKLNNAYDPDAAELLKGLDLDDDEDEFDEDLASSSPQSSHSLLNMLTSSASLDSISAVSSSSPIGLTVPTYASSSDLDIASKPASSVSVGNEEDDDDDDNEDTVVVDRPEIPVVAESVSKDVEATKDNVVKSESSEPKAEDKPAEIAVTPESKPFSPIKPFEVRAPTSSSNKPAVKTSTDSDSRETEETVPSNVSGRRPPVPPPMPAGGMPSQGRILRDGEIVMTSDALNEMLPGGRNDEARDLAAIKFTDNNWYSQVFNEDFFRTIPASSPRQTEREAKFIIDRLGIESGARVLDLCCGFGRHAIELSKRKFDMVGLDLSMVMLKKALADAQARNMAIKFVHGDMRKLSFKAIFDAIYNVQTSFGYFDDLSNFKVLQGIYRALKPGGVFLIETINRDFIVNDLPLRLWWQGHECKLLEEIDMDYVSGVLKVQRSFVFDMMNRMPWEQKIQIRLYTANEMRALLMRAGFNVLELSGDYSLPGAHFGSTSPKNIFVAEKPVK